MSCELRVTCNRRMVQLQFLSPWQSIMQGQTRVEANDDARWTGSLGTPAPCPSKDFPFCPKVVLVLFPVLGLRLAVVVVVRTRQQHCTPLGVGRQRHGKRDDKCRQGPLRGRTITRCRQSNCGRHRVDRVKDRLRHLCSFEQLYRFAPESECEFFNAWPRLKSGEFATGSRRS